jgi:glycosyltransferase involved in cell wall biosynthesis
MHVLYLTNKPIYPLVDGGCKAMKSFLSCLIENNWQIEHLCISTEKHPFSLPAYPAYFQEKITIKSIFVSTKIKIYKALIALVKGESYSMSRFQSIDVTNELKQLIEKKKFDLVILESLYSTGSLDLLKEQSNLKIIVRTHNVEHQLWKEKSIKSTNPFKKWYLSILAKQLRKYEIATLQKVDGIATISLQDEYNFKQLTIQSPIRTIPVAMASLEKRNDYSPDTFFFIGSMNWEPNKEAVQLLLNTIFPLIKKEIPNAQLILAGSFMPQDLLAHQQDGVKIIGFVDDLKLFFNSNGILLSPIQSGSGVRVKLIEAMNMGLPIISTSKGAEGIPQEGQLIIEDNPNDFAEKAVQLYHDSNLRAQLGSKATDFAAKNYSTITIAKSIREFVDTL